MSSSNRLEKFRKAKAESREQFSKSLHESIDSLQKLSQSLTNMNDMRIALSLPASQEKLSLLTDLKNRLAEQTNVSTSSSVATSTSSKTDLSAMTIDELLNIGAKFKKEFSVVQSQVIGNIINDYDKTDSLPIHEIAIKKAISQKILCFIQLRTEILVANEQAYSVHGNRSLKLIRKLFKTFSYIPEDGFLVSLISSDLANSFQTFKNADQTLTAVLEESFSHLSADKKALLNSSLTKVRQNVIHYSENFFEFEDSIAELCEKNTVSKEVYTRWQKEILLELAKQWVIAASDPKYPALIRAQAKFEKAIIEKAVAGGSITLEMDYKSIKKEVLSQFSESEMYEIQYSDTSLSEPQRTAEATPEAITTVIEQRIATLALAQKNQEKKKASAQKLLQMAIIQADLPKIKQMNNAITFAELLIASKHGHDNVLSHLFKNLKFLEMVNDSYQGDTLLSVAAKHDHVGVVKLILRQTKISLATLELALVYAGDMPEKSRQLIVKKYEKLSHTTFSDAVLQQLMAKYVAPKEAMPPSDLVINVPVAEPVQLQTSSAINNTPAVFFEAKKSSTRNHAFFAPAGKNHEETEDQMNRIGKLVPYLDFEVSHSPSALQFYLYKMQTNALLFEMIQYLDIQSHLDREVTQGLYRHTAALMRTALVHSHGLIKRNPDIHELRLLHSEVVEFAKAFILYVKDKDYDNFVKNPFYLKTKAHGKQLGADRRQNQLENISGEMRIHYSLTAGTDVMRFMKFQSNNTLGLPDGLADSAIRMSNITGSVYGLANAGFNQRAAVKDRHVATQSLENRNSWRVGF